MSWIIIASIITIIFILLYCISPVINKSASTQVKISAKNIIEYFATEPTDKTDIFSVEGVSGSKSPASKSALLRETRSIEQDSGQCRNPNQPADLCINYNSCCELSGTNTNCLCSNQIIKDCRQVYKDCLAEKYLSGKSMDFISPENKDIACKKILTNCCQSVSKPSKVADKAFNKLVMHKQAFDANKIFELQGQESEVINNCKNTCMLNESCKSIIYNKITGFCELYDKPLVEKEPAYQNETDSNTLQWQKNIMTSTKREAFLDMKTDDSAQDYCLASANTVSMSPSDSSGTTVAGLNNCWTNNSIIQDCKTQLDKCNKRTIPGLSGTSQQEHCRQMYGACCSILDGMDIQQRFRYLNAESGLPDPKKLLCASLNNKKEDLATCKQKCSTNPDCTYIYSNLGIESNGTANVSDTGFCKLYAGKPLPASLFVPSFSVNKPGQGKYIYKKEEVDPDEPLPTTMATNTNPDKVEQ